MSKFKQYVLTAIGFVILVMTLSFANPGQSNAGSGHDVTVDNGTANPVPTVAQGTTAVTGSVAISNTPTVTVGNAVAISGTPTVTLGTGATVGIDPANNFIRNANDARQPIQIRAPTAPFGAGNPDAQAQGDVYTVPAGKRLVIEHATLRIIGGAGSHALFVLLTELDTPGSTGGQVRHYFKTIDNGVFGGGAYEELLGELPGGRLYADPGTTVSFLIDATAPKSDASCYISGYLVDL